MMELMYKVFIKCVNKKHIFGIGANVQGVSKIGC